jgi:ferredoxin-thioredoxin reductase catalytic chain
MADKTIDQTRKFTEMVAEKQGWELTADEAFYDDLVTGLTTNWNRHGYFLCPCRDSEGDREADADVICPCVYAKADIEEFGHCFCALYCSKGFAASGKKPTGIPERRGGS